MIIYPHKIIHRAIFIIQLIAIQIKLPNAGLILFLIEFFLRYSQTNAHINGQNNTHNIPQNNPTIVQIAAHRVQYLLPPNFFVAKTGRN